MPEIELAASVGGRRLRIQLRGRRPPMEGRIERIVPSGEGLNLFLSTGTRSKRLGPAEIVWIEDQDTGEIVAEVDVACWLWGELLDDEAREHGGIRLETAIDALPIRGLGPDCAKAFARHFRTKARPARPGADPRARGRSENACPS